MIKILSTSLLFFSLIIGQAQNAPQAFHTLADKADALLEECITFHETMGVSAGISMNGTISWHGAAGYMDVSNRIQANSQMLNRTASIAKPMTAMAILQLYEKKKLDLDEPIQTYLPYFPEKKEGMITIRHLLHHSSGIQGYASDDEAFSIYHYESLEEAIAVFMHRSLRHAPGTAFTYTTYGYVLLGAIVEKVSGIPFRDYMTKYIWEEAGMSHTDVEIAGTAYTNKSQLYAMDRSGNIIAGPRTDVSVKVPGGGFHTTVEDLLRFGEAVLAGRLINKKSFQMMIEDSGMKEWGNPYGMGWYLYGDASSETGRVIGHSGSQSGAATQLMIYLDKKVVVAVLGNTTNTHARIYDLTNKLADIALHPEAIEGPLNSIIELPEEDVEVYAGEYANEGGRIIEIFKERHHLFSRVNNGRPYQLYASSEDEFFIRWGDISFRFLMDQQDQSSSLIIIESGDEAEYRRIIPKQSLAQRIEEAMNQQGVEVGLTLYDTYDAEEYDANIEELNRLGDALLDAGRFESALLLFQKNRETFPESLEALEGIGKAYLKLGEEDRAHTYFQQSIALHEGDGFYELAINPPPAYTPTEIPEDSTELFIMRGNPENHTAIIFLQGGPDHQLQVDTDRDPLTSLFGHQDVLRIYPQQAQMINPTILSPNTILTASQSAYEHNISAEILARTICYLQNQGKEVHVIGHSYGSLIILEYLRTKENIADGLYLLGAKLDMDFSHSANLRGSQLIRWRKGLEPIVSTWYMDYAAKDMIEASLDQIFANTKLIVQEHAKRRFSEALAHKNLSNVTMIHGEFDEACGRQSAEGLAFLRSKGAQTLEVYGDHHSMLGIPYMSNLCDHILYDTPLKQSIPSYITDRIEENDVPSEVFTLSHYADAARFHPMNENDMNTLGYELLAANHMQEALNVFTLIVERFPYSWNAHDSQGEAYMLLENYRAAIQSYAQSLELNPDNNNAIDMLQKIKEAMTREP